MNGVPKDTQQAAGTRTLRGPAGTPEMVCGLIAQGCRLCDPLLQRWGAHPLHGSPS